jgi:competence protein ComEC
VAGTRAWILDQLDAERSRWMLWLPVALGLGIAIYFELPSEPALWLGSALAAAAFGLVFFAPAGSLARAVAIGLVAAAVGFRLIAWRTTSLAAPTLSRPLFNINVEGRIADIQRLPESVHVVLKAVRFVVDNAAQGSVWLTKGRSSVHVGDRQLVLANLTVTNRSLRNCVPRVSPKNQIVWPIIIECTI